MTITVTILISHWRLP